VRDDVSPPPPPELSDAAIDAASVLCGGARTATPPAWRAEGGGEAARLSLGVRLRLKRAAARARDATARRRTAEKQIIGYLEIVDERGAQHTHAARAPPTWRLPARSPACSSRCHPERATERRKHALTAAAAAAHRAQS
jgi:hypothetical protein